MFDKDRSGFVSSSEIKAVMIEATIFLKQFSIGFQADVNGDNQVNFEEFKAMKTAKKQLPVTGVLVVKISIFSRNKCTIQSLQLFVV